MTSKSSNTSPTRPAIPPAVLTHQKVQCGAVLGLGLTYLFTTPSFVHSLESTFSSYLPFLPATLPVLPSILNHHLLAQQQQISGAILMGIGSAYLLSLWHHQYEYLYQTVPARLVIAAAGIGTWIVAPERVGVSLALIILNDGVSAGLAGWALGQNGFTGKAPKADEKTE